MKKQPNPPTLAELRKLAREVWGDGANVREHRWSWGIWECTAYAPQRDPRTVGVDHPSRATARRMLWAALMAAKGGG